MNAGRLLNELGLSFKGHLGHSSIPHRAYRAAVHAAVEVFTPRVTANDDAKLSPLVLGELPEGAGYAVFASFLLLRRGKADL